MAFLLYFGVTSFWVDESKDLSNRAQNSSRSDAKSKLRRPWTHTEGGLSMMVVRIFSSSRMLYKRLSCEPPKRRLNDI